MKKDQTIEIRLYLIWQSSMRRILNILCRNSEVISIPAVYLAKNTSLMPIIDAFVGQCMLKSLIYATKMYVKII
jgi:hypothetical protein